MTTKNKAISRAGKARRSAARARDAELAATALAMLEDPDIGERIAALVSTPRLLTYSLRNQALLLGQADERGMVVTDVDTYRGWQRRGRHVRAGEHGLKIVRPVRRSGEPTNTDTINTDTGSEREGGTDIGFRTMTVFDLSQTDASEGPEDTDVEHTEVPERDAAAGTRSQALTVVGTSTSTGAGIAVECEQGLLLGPEEVLLDSLRDQAERAGYLTIVLPANPGGAGSVSVDHHGQTISVYYDGDRATLSEFAGTLASIIAAQAKANDQAGNVN